MEKENSIESKYPTTAPRKRSILDNSYKHDYPILEYQEKFKINYTQMKSSLASISGNITNYKYEIAKLEDFLILINDHEKNYKNLIKKYNFLKKILEETIEIESLIGKLSSNQQIINMSEYVNLHEKVREIIKYFQESRLNDKKDYESNMIKLMWRGFKVYEETFYVILKRYELLEVNSTTENERLNLLNKINSLAECLQDDLIKFDFTSKLIKDRREKIITVFNDMQLVVPKNINDDNYEKNSCLITLLLISSEKLFLQEKEYIYKILHTCTNELKESVYDKIIESPLEKIINNLKDLISKHNKGYIKRVDFYQNFDILNIWHEKICNNYQNLLKKLNNKNLEIFTDSMKSIQSFCYKYIDDYVRDILHLNEKIENENVLKTCNDVIFFLSTILLFDVAYRTIKSDIEAHGGKFSIDIIIDNLIKRINVKSASLEKKYAPLKFIFMINNIFFIQSKIYQKPFNKYISKFFTDSLSKIINENVEKYLESSWGKLDLITFNEKDKVLIYENDGKTLKNSSKENMKKKFATFNEIMKINLKFQQQIQIIDASLEKKLIDSNIEYICGKYQKFYEKYNNCGFTKFRNKYILYTSSSDVMQDLKMYFMADMTKNK